MQATTGSWDTSSVPRAVVSCVWQGLASVNVKGIENIDVTEDVPGHMAYRGMMPTLLDKVGWAVESLEYTEIEDPDPENHEKRQRELLDEIEEARKQLDEQPEKRGIQGLLLAQESTAEEVVGDVR
ncbi:hypothetical protein MRB53_041061 [Persea americana]|nr:hypothetical protein MRB53_041061 [Persea americana]